MLWLKGDLSNLSNYSVVLDDYPDKDNTASGLLFRRYVAINDTGVGCPLCISTNSRFKDKLVQCDSNKNSSVMPCDFLALQSGKGMKLVLWSGSLRKDSWTWTQGDRIYVSTVEGALTNIKPENGHWVQEIGVASYSNVVLFRPKHAFDGSSF